MIRSLCLIFLLAPTISYAVGSRRFPPRLQSTSQRPARAQTDQTPPVCQNVFADEKAGYADEPVFDNLTHERAARTKRGLRLLKSGHVEAAIKEFRRSLDIDNELGTRDARTHTQLGFAYRQAGLFEAAFDQYKIALEIDERQKVDNRKGLMNLAETAWRLPGALESDFEKSFAILDLAILRYGDDVHFLGLKAKLLFMLKRYQESMAVLDQLLKLNPKDAMALNLKRKIQTTLSEDQPAEIMHPAQVSESTAPMAEELKNAVVLFGQMKYQKCLEEIDHYLAKHPKDFSALKLQAEALLSMGKSNQAAQIVDGILKISPEDDTALAIRADILVALDQGEAALETARKIQNPELRALSFAKSYMALEQLTSADSTLIRSHLQSNEAIWLRAQIYYQDGQFPRALLMIEKLLDQPLLQNCNWLKFALIKAGQDGNLLSRVNDQESWLARLRRQKPADFAASVQHVKKTGWNVVVAQVNNELRAARLGLLEVLESDLASEEVLREIAVAPPIESNLPKPATKPISEPATQPALASEPVHSPVSKPKSDKLKLKPPASATKKPSKAPAKPKKQSKPRDFGYSWVYRGD